MTTLVRGVAAAVVLSFVLVGGSLAVDGAFERSGDYYRVQDETVTGNPSLTPGVYALSNSNLENASYRPTVTITNSSSTVRMIEGADYEWHQANGTVEVIDGGRLDGSDQMIVDYALTQQQERETAMLDIATRQFDFAGALLLGMFGLILLAGLGVMGGS